MSDDNDIEIEIEDDDGPSAVQIPEPGEPSAKTPKIVSADDGIAALKAQMAEQQRQLAEQKAARQEAEARAARAEREAGTSQSSALESQLHHFNSVLGELNATATSVQREVEQYYRDGEYAKASEANRKLARLEAQMMLVEQGKTNLERQKSAPQPQTTERQRAEPQGDPVDRWIASLPPKSREWAERHRDDVADDGRRNLMVRGHHAAVADGIAIESPEYFARVEEMMQPKTEQARTPLRKPQPAAPTSRSAPSTAAKTPIKVVLTGEQRAMAKSLGMTEQKYAANVYRLKKEGRIS